MAHLEVSLLEPFLLCAVLAFLGWQLLKAALLLAEYLTGRSIYVRSLLVGLRPKLWMTIGLGLFFSMLYVVLLFVLSFLLDASKRYALFSFAYAHPIYCAYVGLALFVATSLLILAVRSVIKRIYNNKQ